MPDQLQLRGGTTSEHSSFTGAAREVTVDTTKKTLVVHDGSQAGGTPLMKESGGTTDASINGVNVGKGANSVSGNTVLGETALDAAVTGQNNTAIGKNALSNNTSGQANTAVGSFTADSVTTGSYNTAIGLQS